MWKVSFILFLKNTLYFFIFDMGSSEISMLIKHIIYAYAYTYTYAYGRLHLFSPSFLFKYDSTFSVQFVVIITPPLLFAHTAHYQHSKYFYLNLLRWMHHVYYMFRDFWCTLKFHLKQRASWQWKWSTHSDVIQR